MKNSFIYKFTNNDSLIDNILKKYKMEEIIKKHFSRLPHIFQTNALTKGFPIFKGHYFL